MLEFVAAWAQALSQNILLLSFADKPLFKDKENICSAGKKQNDHIFSSHLCRIKHTYL